MVSIAYFSDDESGPLCALMTAVALARIDARVVVGVPPGLVRADAVPPGSVTSLELDGSVPVADIGRAALAAARSGTDLVAALPLDRVRDATLRARFDAVVTVGGDHAAAARALRVARYDTAAPGTRGPAWFLARSDQSLLMTKARLRSAGGPRLPFAVRTLPFAMPRLSSAEIEALRVWRPGDAVLGGGVLLAALCVAVAADPHATELGGSDLAAMMAAEEPPTRAATAARLGALARLFSDTAVGPAREDRRGAPGRPRDRRVLVAGAVRPAREAAPALGRRVRGA